ncbi:MAG: hypothetical protein JNK58_10325 [Phycisphaerae bacterium]|nr:hypothetical protein [Phycisphaerae bacterium]
MHEHTVVLKFGSSVIPSESALTDVVGEVRRWCARGSRVVAVVSAVGGATDMLLGHARSFGAATRSASAALAAYVATGELQSAALLGLALARSGIDAAVRDPASIGLLTDGPPLDSTPIRLDVSALARAIAGWPVVIVPGFLGRSSTGETTLLGRGGSDLTALFLAHHLRARCRLVKDVNGLYDRDPAEGDARRFERVNYADVLALSEGIVQHKAVRFALEVGLEFEVGCIGLERPTTVGGRSSRLEEPEECASVG